jgi:hypothetical protein
MAHIGKLKGINAMPAPIAVFAFNRLEHLRRTLTALTANDLATISDVAIFCDAPHNGQEKSLTDVVSGYEQFSRRGGFVR